MSFINYSPIKIEPVSYVIAQKVVHSRSTPVRRMFNLLRLKHWQIFWLIAGVSFVAEAIKLLNDYLVPAELYTPLADQFATIANVFCTIGHAVWLYALTKFMHERLRPEADMIPFNVFVAVFFIDLAISGVAYIMPVIIAATTSAVNFGILTMVTGLFAILALTTGVVLCYFAARTMVSVEAGRRAYISDYLGTLFLLLFYPIGIWWIQPRLNRVFGSEEAYRANTPLDQDI